MSKQHADGVKHYSREEAREILAQALKHPEKLEEGFSQEELLEAAAEAGIDADEVKRAALRLRQRRDLESQMQEERANKKRRFWRRFARFILLATFLTALNATISGAWWVHWVWLSVGFALLSSGLQAFLPPGKKEEQKIRDRMEKEERRLLKNQELREKLAKRRELGHEVEAVVTQGLRKVLDAVSLQLGGSQTRPPNHAREKSSAQVKEVRVAPDLRDENGQRSSDVEEVEVSISTEDSTRERR